MSDRSRPIIRAAPETPATASEPSVRHSSDYGPYDTIGCAEAEAAFLGAVLLAENPRALLDLLGAADFADPRNAAVYEAASGCQAAGMRPDPVCVQGWLRRTGTETAMTADTSAAGYLAMLAGAAPVVASGRFYAQVVVEHAVRRRVAQAADRLGQAAGTYSMVALGAIVIEELDAVVVDTRRAAACVAVDVLAVVA